MMRFENCSLWTENGKLVGFEGHEVVYSVANENYKGDKVIKAFDRWGNYVFVKGGSAEEFFDTANRYIKSPAVFNQFTLTDKRMLAVYGRRLARYSQTVPDISVTEAAKLFAIERGGAFRFTKEVIKSAESYLVNHLNCQESSPKPEKVLRKPADEIKAIKTMFGLVRSININGERWYATIDIGKILGMHNVRRWNSIFEKDKVKKVRVEAMRGSHLIFIDKTCMAQIISRARLPYMPLERTQLIHELLESEAI